MNVQVQIVDGPVPPDAVTAAAALADGGEAGALLRFDGIVRRMEDGRPLQALHYEAYEPMASRELLALARETAAKHGLLWLQAWHSRGEVPVGAVSFVLLVCAAHRAEAISAVDHFIRQLKRDVPIWKRPCWEAGSAAARGDAPPGPGSFLAGG